MFAIDRYVLGSLTALIKETERKIFLILDNLRVHHSKPVKAWVVEHQDKSQT
jgi:hypothetical protein